MPAWAPARRGAVLESPLLRGPGAEERENGEGVRVRAHFRPAFAMSPVYSLAGQPKLRAGPSSSVPPTALAQGLHAVWELLSVPYKHVMNKLFTLITWDSVALRSVSALLKEVNVRR